MTTLIYEGPAGAVNREVGAETGAGDLLEPGREYDLSDDLARRLLQSGAGWRRRRSGRRGADAKTGDVSQEDDDA